MRPSLTFILAAAVVLAPRVARASNVTANDLVKLSAAGLNDDVLIALIESDGVVFKLTPEEILSLRDRGLSQKVILAMLRTGKPRPAASPAVPPDTDQSTVVPVPPSPGVVSVEVAPTAPAPVIVNVTQQVEQAPSPPAYYPFTTHVAVPVAVPVYVVPPRPVKKPEPVYWGFGGQRRPDTWRDRDRDKDRNKND